MAVAAQCGEDHTLFARLLGPVGLTDRSRNRMGRLRGGDDAFGAGELQRTGEAFGLADRLSLDQVRLVQVRNQRRHAVIAQATRVDRIGDEVVPEGVHFHERRHARGVTEVVAVLALTHRRARRRLDATDRRVHVALQLFAKEREAETAEVRAATGAADEHIGLFADLGELEQRLLADDRLVQQHMVEHRAEGVPGGGILDRHGDSLGDRDAERARMIRILSEQLATEVGLVAR